MAEDRPIYIIGAPARGRVSLIEGTRTIECELCKEPTFFSPASFSRPEAKTGKFVCMGCASQLEGPTEIGPVTGEQMSELANAFIMFTVYRDPSDYPGKYVVRRSRIVGAEILMDATPLAVTGSLADARVAIHKTDRPGLICQQRLPEDEPQIVEVWF